MSEVLSSGLTLTIPSTGEENWGPSIKSLCFQKISEHDHTGSGKGLQLGSNSLSNGAITLAKMADIATDKLIGRDTAGTGVPEAIGVGGGIEFSGSGSIQLTAGYYTPTGAILMTGKSAADTGFLLCDGTAVSRSTYSALFSAIGTTYGVGDGSTTFNVPDMRQKFPIGKAASGTGSTLGGTGGNIDHTHSTPNHSHAVNSHTHSIPAHYHGYGTGADLKFTGSTKGVDGDHTHKVIADDPITGSNSLTANNYVARSRDAGNDFSYGIDNGGTAVAATLGKTGGSGAHFHNIDSSLDAFSNPYTWTGRIGLVTGGVDGNAAMTSGGAGSTTDTSGAGTSGSANPPFLSINFMIKT